MNPFKHNTLLLLVFLFIPLTTLPTPTAPTSESTNLESKLGELPAPSLLGRWGKAWQPAELLTPRTKLLVVFSMGVKCPLVRKLVPKMNRLQETYLEKGVQFVGLFSNAGLNIFEMADYATEMDVIYPIFREDYETRWHKQLKLKTTPQVAVLDVQNGYADAQVIYRGAVDDSLWAAGGPGVAKKTFLVDAIEDYLNGRPVALSSTAASGCTISEKEYRDLSAFEGVTYYKDIAPIVQKKCQGCHREGDLAGEYYIFDTYEDVAGNHETILDRIDSRIMPPWHAHIIDEKKYGGFVGDARLSQDEIDTFKMWVKDDLPLGDRANAPEKIEYPMPDAWQIGEGQPDFIFEMDPPYQVPLEKLDEYQYYRVKLNFPEDRYVRGFQLRPGNLAVVHHIAALLAPHTTEELSGHQTMLKLYGLTGSKVKKVGDYVPGDPYNARTYPEGQGIKIPKNHDIVFEMHYTPTGKKEKPDVSSLGIVWAEGKPKREIKTKISQKKRIRIPPHAQHYRVERYFGIEEDAVITAIAPHMHYRGKSFSLYRVFNRGTDKEEREIIYRVPNYDFGWQRTYELTKPIKLRAGEYLLGVCHFDNSHFNPNNPDPNVRVDWGLKSEDEMFGMRAKYYKWENADEDTSQE